MNELEKIGKEIGSDIVQYWLFKETSYTNLPKPTKYTMVFRSLADVLKKLNDDEDLILQIVMKFDKVGLDGVAEILNYILCDQTLGWDRVALAFAFVGWLGSHMYKRRKDMKGVMNMGEFAGYYITLRIKPWLQEQGGWPSHPAAQDLWFYTWVKGMVIATFAIGISQLMF